MNTLNNNTLLAIYNDVFSMKGNVKLYSPGPPLQYIVDRIYILTECPVTSNIMDCVYRLPQEKMASLLFKAVAGDYIAGPTAFSVDICRIQSDPMTGFLSFVDETQENRTVLTIFVVILFVILGYIIYEREKKI